MRKRCFMCGEVKKLTRHHVMPKSFGGTEVDDYKITLCEDCHKFVHFKIDKLNNPTFEDILRSFIKIKIRKSQEEKEVQWDTTKTKTKTKKNPKNLKTIK